MSSIRLRRAAPLSLGLALLTLAAVAPLAPRAARAQAPAAGATVQIKNFDFAPMTVTVARGATVTWTNRDGEPHTVTSLDGLFRSGALDQDQSYRFKFDKPGTYKYLCTIHPKMTAVVVVK